MSFEPIDTQEKFDSAISERLKRERETVSKRYADYDELRSKVSTYEQQIADMTKAADEASKKYAEYDRQMSELQSRIKGYETDSVKTRIAHETGLPFELAQRLTGDTEDAIRADAESLSRLVGKKSAPLRSPEEVPADGKAAALRSFTANLLKNNS